MKAFLLSWKRWETHTTNCQRYWKGRPFLEALFVPSVSQLSHYLGERSMSGPTAAAGAHTSLAGCAKALKLDFLMQDETVKGWSELKRNHQPTQQIPIAVAVVAHFQYILETTTFLFVASIRANQWISMTGLIGEAHIQRSHLVRETKHAHVFFCGRQEQRQALSWGPS